VGSIHGTGDFYLELVDTDAIKNTSNIAIGGSGNNNGSFIGQTYSEGQVFPHVVSINRSDPSDSSTHATTLNYAVTFSASVTGVDASDFSLATTGTAGASAPVSVSGSGSGYTVTVTGVTGTGNIGLNLVDDGSIKDAAGNPLVSSSATASYQSPSTISTSSGPNSMIVADLNADGKPDLAVLAGSAVGVRLGNGDGTFASQTTFSTGSGSEPESLAIADVNGDGKPDLMLSNYTHNNPYTVIELIGNGDGSFQTARTAVVGYYNHFLAAADLNGTENQIFSWRRTPTIIGPWRS